MRISDWSSDVCSSDLLKLPLAALHASTAKGAPQGLRTKHPEAPEVCIDGHTVGVSLSVDTPTVRVLENILSEQECDELIELARPRLQRALTVDSEDRQSAV